MNSLIDSLLPGLLFCFVAGAGLGLVVLLVNRSYKRVYQFMLVVQIFVALLGGLLGVGLALWVLSDPTAHEQTSMLVLPIQPEATSSQSEEPGAALDFDIPAIALSVKVDRLSALFLLLICGASLFTSTYSLGYLWNEPPEQIPVLLATFYNLFLLAMCVVVVANDVLSFLLSWELMTVFSVIFTLYKHNKLVKVSPEEHSSAKRANQIEEAITAPKVYLTASHVSLLCITLSLFILGGQARSVPSEACSTAGSFSFDCLHMANPPASPALWLAFLLGFVGFGIKAGLVPFHIWLPYAHPASPSNVHALMSGIMVKLAVYGMIRFFVETVAPFSSVQGVLVLLAGAITALIGVLYALVSHDLKEALAYHSIENLGIIFVGLGVGMIFLVPIPSIEYSTHTGLAVLGLTAAVAHTFNHGVFKSLLFLCTGVFDKWAGHVDLDRLRGLGRVPGLRLVCVAFLIGAIAIAGFPPLNGFVSEWLTFHALISPLAALGADADAMPLLLIIVVVGLLLALSVVLTAYCFAKLTWPILGRPDENTPPHTLGLPGLPMQLAALGLAALCIVLGLLPVLLLRPITSTLADLVNVGSANAPIAVSGTADLSLVSIHIVGTDYHAASRPLSLAVLIGGGSAVVLLILWISGGLKRKAPTTKLAQQPWLFGMPAPSPTDQPKINVLTDLVRYHFRHFYEFANYLTPHALQKSLERTSKERFRKLYGTKLDGKQFFLRHNFDTSSAVEVFRYIYNLLLSGLRKTAEWTSHQLHGGDLRTYIAYIILVYLTVVAIKVFNLWP